MPRKAFTKRFKDSSSKQKKETNDTERRNIYFRMYNLIFKLYNCTFDITWKISLCNVNEKNELNKQQQKNPK